MRRPVLILGATPYTAVFVDMFETIPGIVFSGCVENLDQTKCDTRIANLPVYWHEGISRFRETHDLICSLATTRRSGWITGMQEAGFSFTSLVHPSAVVSTRTKIAAGGSVDAGCVVAGYSYIAPHVRIGRRVSVGHHTHIGAFSTLHPGCVVSGNCHIGQKVTLGTGCIIIDGIEIGPGAVIAAGAIVTRNVPERAMVAGNPAVVKRYDYGPK